MRIDLRDDESAQPRWVKWTMAIGPVAKAGVLDLIWLSAWAWSHPNGRSSFKLASMSDQSSSCPWF